MFLKVFSCFYVRLFWTDCKVHRNEYCFYRVVSCISIWYADSSPTTGPSCLFLSFCYHSSFKDKPAELEFHRCFWGMWTPSMCVIFRVRYFLFMKWGHCLLLAFVNGNDGLMKFPLFTLDGPVTTQHCIIQYRAICQYSSCDTWKKQILTISCRVLVCVLIDSGSFPP